MHPALGSPAAVERDEVGDVERDDDALLPGGQCEYVGVRAPSLASRLDDRSHVVATLAQLSSDRPREHLVEEESDHARRSSLVRW